MNIEELAEKVRHLEMELKRQAQPTKPYSSAIFGDRSDRNLVKLEARPQFIPLLAPLTSTSWDGDAFSTTAKTKIDLSAVFAVPAGVKAVLLLATIRDSGSSAADVFALFDASDTANNGAVTIRTSYLADDSFRSINGICPCNADGDIYYQVAASGAGTMDIYLQIWGYWT